LKIGELEYNIFVSKKMTLKRFKFLYSKFTFFSKADKKDGKIIKEPKIVKHLNKKFKLHLKPGEHLSIDESICAFKGRILNRVYNKEKPNKFGIKIYALCDSKHLTY
jgi:hypothetical protein